MIVKSYQLDKINNNDFNFYLFYGENEGYKNELINKFFDIKKSKNITYSHEPVNLKNNKTLNICGHYHPKIYIKNNGDKLSFRCFAMDKNKNTLFLPAFGDLTGGYPCKKSFKKWAIVSEEEIIEIKS